MKKVWVVGKWLEEINSKVAWSFQGVFSSEKNAILACCGQDYFIAPVFIDMCISEEDISWPDAYYPLQIIQKEIEDEKRRCLQAN